MNLQINIIVPKDYTFRPDNTKIVEITNEGPEEVILDSFIAG